MFRSFYQTKNQFLKFEDACSNKTIRAFTLIDYKLYSRGNDTNTYLVSPS